MWVPFSEMPPKRQTSLICLLQAQYRKNPDFFRDFMLAGLNCRAPIEAELCCQSEVLQLCGTGRHSRGFFFANNLEWCEWRLVTKKRSSAKRMTAG
jgi:hypothetical protein